MRTNAEWRWKRGQSTLEYVLVVAAVLAAIVAVVTTTMRPAVTRTLTESQSTIEAAAGKLKSGLGL